MILSRLKSILSRTKSENEKIKINRGVKVDFIEIKVDFIEIKVDFIEKKSRKNENNKIQTWPYYASVSCTSTLVQLFGG